MLLAPLYHRFLPTPQPGSPSSASPVCPLPSGLPTHPFSIGHNQGLALADEKNDMPIQCQGYQADASQYQACRPASFLCSAHPIPATHGREATVCKPAGTRWGIGSVQGSV